MEFALPPSAAIVCHDAGAANIVLAWLQADVSGSHRVHVSGPAARLFGDAHVGLRCASIEDALTGASVLVSGTGWASDVEHRARELARAAGLHSIAVLDHWVNYRERFERGGTTVLPDEIWVTDAHALRLAQDAFPDTRVVLQPNFYVRALQRHIAAVAPAEPAEVLYVLEPLRTDFGRGPAGELQALDYFVAALPRLGLPADMRLRLRLHPSEPTGKYDQWMRSQHGLCIECTSVSEPLSMAIGRASLVAGCHSQALAIAVGAGKRVLCTLPPWAPPCVLPFSQIEHLSRA